ncbi:MAG: undecaprenyl/decaprenyl-phosphate alpha-N-acetylglucosaminyl 1-phosphate transferase [Nitrospinae bacterium]|nr:undecaprenyl/decaprenyl-phosphate alpha-N-acetylglucosaminyl 1-phosphate transferase [Nitrospinota bacterium]MZH05863.1 undecaprenyl/decaprenyl-phosphate alpha-N-acetylglucosaminyl 1-phosphate transferase [Nitrospinota bacterium]MZH15516.1 undecaprenyl/decaprenyl-phosphate alpha-N-acetylglucosaminyl 1-phosphate transferase [Nitrospinota bacterium]
MKFQTFPISGEVYLVGYFIALGLSIAITLFLIKVPFKFTLNQPSKGKNVKSLGGIPVVLSFLVTLWLFHLIGLIDPRHINLLTVITVSTGTMMVLGIYDDITQCTARLKLTVQILIACILYKCGFQIERIGDLIELGNFSILLTVLWIVGITNAINLIDGMDGLAPGIIFFSCLTLVFVYLERQIIGASFLAVILAGSVLGFFFFNFPPAKIILGDTGSLPLGLLISLITLLPLNQGYTDEIYYLIPVITLLIPILDTTFAFFRRIFKGTSPFLKDADHFHHRLGKLGLTPVKSISILFIIGFYFDLTALATVYNITLIPKLIPIYFIFIIVNVAVLVTILKRKEKNLPHG